MKQGKPTMGPLQESFLAMLSIRLSVTFAPLDGKYVCFKNNFQETIELPGGPVAKDLCFQWWGLGSIPRLGNQIPHSTKTQGSQIKKKEKKF